MTDSETQLVDFIADTGYSDIPDEAATFTKQLALKTIAGMVAGSVQPSGRKMAKYIASKQGTAEEAGVIGLGTRTSMENAVLANGVFAHASELEDDLISSERGITSWDITTFPVTFSLAERYRLSGKEFIVASTIGMEVLTRLSLSPNRGPTDRIPFQSASMAAAAAAASAMRLDREEIANALGMASAGGFVFTPLTGTDAHYTDSAFQCVRGVRAAELAAEGLTGNLYLEKLFDSMYRDDAVPLEQVTDSIGEEWLFRDIEVKKYPCCFYNHRYIDLLIEMIQENGIKIEEIEEVHTVVPAVEADIVNIPELSQTEDTKFSIQHHLGAVLVDRDVSYEHISADCLHDPVYGDARSMVSVTVPGDSDTVPMSKPAEITITLSGGEELSGTRKNMIGSPQDPLEEHQFQELFRKFTKGVLEDTLISRLEDQILTAEKLPDMQRVSQSLVNRT